MNTTSLADRSCRATIIGTVRSFSESAGPWGVKEAARRLQILHCDIWYYLQQSIGPFFSRSRVGRRLAL